MRIATSSNLSTGIVGLLVLLASACASTGAAAQVQASEADFAAAASATARTHHGLGTPGGGVSRDDLDSPREAFVPAGSLPMFGGGGGSTAGLFYPGDLTNHGGAVIKKMVSHPIFLDGHGVCPSVTACWGDPATFLKALGDSTLIHVVDQYVGATTAGRYTVTTPVTATNPASPPTPLTDAQIQAVVHAVAASGGAGYTNMYEVFLTPGTDICFDNTYTVCYSPDNPATFQFCAYHGSVTFNDIGHVIYSVQPYVGTISGCEAGGALPNGELADSTNSVLKHEVIEAITDPDGNAWWNSANNSLYGSEIEDECMFLNSAFKIVTSQWTSDSHKYATQQSYLNSKHACGIAP